MWKVWKLQDNKWKFVVKFSSRLHNFKTGYFTSWIGLEQLWNVQKRKMHVQSVQNNCFSSSIMQICDVVFLVVLGVVVWRKIRYLALIVVWFASFSLCSHLERLNPMYLYFFTNRVSPHQCRVSLTASCMAGREKASERLRKQELLCWIRLIALFFGPVSFYTARPLSGLYRKFRKRPRRWQGKSTCFTSVLHLTEDMILPFPGKQHCIFVTWLTWGTNFGMKRVERVKFAS